mmetsp:Transcript_42102/g.121625  ORF Transcript_42102/g.121625 Transcript_42102/m.121625 type:complete len:236 (+) Transcript_42102:72-779(+)
MGSASQPPASRVPCPHLLPVFQNFFNAHQVPWTRDRKHRAGCAVPSGYTVTQVERLHNPQRWEQYCKARDAAAATCAAAAGFKPVDVQTSPLEQTLVGSGAGLCQRCNERFLFHGSEAAEQIVAGHFDLSRANGQSLLGKQIYFAEVAGKSDEYAGTVGAGLKMLVCRVVLGVQLYTDDRAPTAAQKATFEQTTQNGQYHSIRSYRKDTTQLNEFAMGRVDLVYPEYVITYTRLP